MAGGRSRAGVLLVLVAVVPAACNDSDRPEVVGGGGTTAPPSAEQVAEARQRETYRRGFTSACEQVFTRGQDGVLTDPDREETFTVDDCLDRLDETKADDVPGPAQAIGEGRKDGFDAAFELPSAGVLCRGAQCFTRADFG
jgi:hypothetical protein